MSTAKKLFLPFFLAASLCGCSTLLHPGHGVEASNNRAAIGKNVDQHQQTTSKDIIPLAKLMGGLAIVIVSLSYTLIFILFKRGLRRIEDRHREERRSWHKSIDK